MIEKTVVPAVDAVLVGAGVNHLETIRRYSTLGQKPFRLTLISEQPMCFPSGMLGELVAKTATPSAIGLDAGQLCQLSDARFVCGSAIFVDTHNHTVTLRNGTQIPYDVISLDLESEPHPPGLPGRVAQISWTIRPIHRLLRHLEDLERTLPNRRQPYRLVVSGGNLTSIELIWALHDRFHEALRAGHLTLAFIVHPDERHALPERVLNNSLERIQRSDISVHRGSSVSDFDEDSQQLLLTGKNRVVCDSLIWANVFSAPSWLKQTDIKLDKHGLIRTLPNLESISHHSVYAAGETISLPQHRIGCRLSSDPKMADTLSSNLIRKFQGLNQIKYTPAVTTRVSHGSMRRQQCTIGKLAVTSRWMGRVEKSKRQRYWKRFHLPQRPPRVSTYLESGQIEFSPVGGEAGRLPFNKKLWRQQGGALLSPNLFLDPQNATFQAAFNLRYFTHDLFSFGQIAVNHLLNHLFCVGVHEAQMHVALSLPYAPKQALERDYQLLMNAIKTATKPFGIELRCISTQSSQQAVVGLFAQGQLPDNPARAFTTIDKPATVILTKPLGTGITSAGFQNFHVSTGCYLSAQQHMKQSHFAITDLLRSTHIRSVFPICGHGLAAETVHLLNQNLALVINPHQLPKFQGTESAIRQGVRTSLHVQNRLPFTSSIATLSKEVLSLAELLFDPQTSGAILIVCDQAYTEEVLQKLQSAGFSAACSIGNIIDRPDVTKPQLLFSS